MISPQYPVKISITPISLNQPHVYDPKRQSFTSKNSGQSIYQTGHYDGNYLNKQNLNYMNNILNKENQEDSKNPIQTQLISLLSQNYCLGSINNFL